MFFIHKDKKGIVLPHLTDYKKRGILRQKCSLPFIKCAYFCLSPFKTKLLLHSKLFCNAEPALFLFEPLPADGIANFWLIYSIFTAFPQKTIAAIDSFVYNT